MSSGDVKFKFRIPAPTGRTSDDSSTRGSSRNNDLKPATQRGRRSPASLLSAEDQARLANTPEAAFAKLGDYRDDKEANKNRKRSPSAPASHLINDSSPDPEYGLPKVAR